MFPAITTTVPTLSNWQLSLGGLTMGLGTPYGFSTLEGIADGPTIRNGDVDRPRDQGQYLGLDFAAGRDIILTGDANTDGTSLQHALEVLGTSMFAQVTEMPLWFQLPNLPLLCSMVRPRKNTTPIDFGYSFGLAKKILGFHSTDPRLYAAPSAGSVGVPKPLGGLTFNASFPLAFGGGSVAGILNVTNTGNVECRPILVFTGPMTNPTVTNETTGWSLSFSNPSQSGYTLNAGDVMTVDTDLRSITYVAAGTAAGTSHANWLVAGSTWPSVLGGLPGLAPGANLVEFNTQDTSTVAGTLGVQFSSAYIL
jgi:hypothetical protein